MQVDPLVRRSELGYHVASGGTGGVMAMNRDAKTRQVLVLQGGGALGSYQAGVFDALSRAKVVPDWVAGISIGAINAAIIAGNPVARRTERLAEFWELVTSGLSVPMPRASDALRRDVGVITKSAGTAMAGVLADGLAAAEKAVGWRGPSVVPVLKGRPGHLDTAKVMGVLGDEFARHWSEFATAVAIFRGAPGFFKPKWSPALPWLKGHLSYYDTAPLQATLNRLVDWDRLNSGEMQVSVGAVGVKSGNFRYFDTEKERIGVEHIMAASAYPPGLPPVEVEGEMWWDGGEASNTPIDYVLENDRNSDMQVYQIDLFPARGPMPDTILEVEARAQDIRFSSRTRSATANKLQLAEARRAFHSLVAKLPPELRDSPEIKVLTEVARENRVAIAQLIYRDKLRQGSSKYVDFSRVSMTAHWAAGRGDAERTIRSAAWKAQPMQAGTVVHDLGRVPRRVKG